MKRLILVLVLLFSGNVYAGDYEIYAVDRPDGQISVVYYFPGSSDTLDEVIFNLGFSGLNVRKIEDNLPSRADREFWKAQGGKVVVDSVKKQEKLNKIAEKESAKQAALTKLKVTEKELNDALGK